MVRLIIFLFSTTCYWGADRCWIDLNHFHIFDPIRHPDGSPTSTFGLQLPAFMTTLDDYLEALLRILGGGQPLARVIRSGSDFAAFAKTSGAASQASLSPVTDAVAAVLSAAAATGHAGTAAVAGP
ncbi:hypothetical protein BGZ54_010476 [Gamsiella multidivaricata]|nr:hypothetical protein BGZ54_010476 [Gamsiella multidivaricata]